MTTQPHQSRPFRLALRECERWGVDVLFDHAIPPLADTHGAPTLAGGVWVCDTENNACIYLDGKPDGSESAEEAAALLHELTHAIVYIATGKTPAEQDEMRLIALDKAGCRLTGADWREWMGNFQTGEGDWPCLNTRRRGEMLAESELWLEAQGLMHNGKPTYRIARRDGRKAA